MTVDVGGLRSIAINIGLRPRTIPDPPPNCTSLFPCYDVDDQSCITSLLRLKTWEVFLDSYPGYLRERILGMIRHGALLGHKGAITQRLSKKNLPLTDEERTAIGEDMRVQLETKQTRLLRLTGRRRPLTVLSCRATATRLCPPATVRSLSQERLEPIIICLGLGVFPLP